MVDLFPDLTIELAEHCKAQGLDTSKVTSAIKDMLGADSIVDFSIWSGPVPKHGENLVLDVFILGTNYLYNYERRPSEMAHALPLWRVDFLTFMPVSGEADLYVLLISHPGKSSPFYLWTRSQGLDRVKRFRQSLLLAMEKSRKEKD